MTSDNTGSKKKIRRPSNPDKSAAIDYMFFGRRHGRGLRAGRKDALAQLLPILSLGERLGERPEKIHDVAGLFEDGDGPVWMEIGFGSGEYLAAMLKTHPAHRFIGCEPFINGVSSLLKFLGAGHAGLEEKDYAGRLRLWTDSAEIILDALPDACLERVYLLNPDPWPKKRHHKRRFVQQVNLERIARVLKPGGMFITATDVAELGDWMLEHTLRHGAFEWTARGKEDWATMPKDWMATTRYAQKGEDAGRKEIYLLFRRRGDV